MLLQKTLAPLYRPPPTFEFWILVKRAQLFFSLPISLSLKQFYDCRVQRSRIKFSFLVSFSLKKIVRITKHLPKIRQFRAKRQMFQAWIKTKQFQNYESEFSRIFLTSEKKVFLTLISLFFGQKPVLDRRHDFHLRP